MRALTLHQPWAFAVAHLGKDVENRTWRPPEQVIGVRIAIHAGRKFDTDTLPWFFGRGLINVPLTPVLGAVVATAVVAGVAEHADSVWFSGSVGAFWFTGPIGWVLRDVVALAEPVPCRGAQGLWTVPNDVEQRVTAQEVMRG